MKFYLCDHWQKCPPPLRNKCIHSRPHDYKSVLPVCAIVHCKEWRAKIFLGGVIGYKPKGQLDAVCVEQKIPNGWLYVWRWTKRKAINKQ